MALTVVRLPRSFAGDKGAPLEDFFNSMANALARGDPAKKVAIQHFCTRVLANLSARDLRHWWPAEAVTQQHAAAAREHREGHRALGRLD